MVRGFGRSAPAGAEIPSAYIASVFRSNRTPAVPHVGLRTLLSLPSMLRNGGGRRCGSYVESGSVEAEQPY